MHRPYTKDLTHIALVAVFLAVCAWICLPTAVPFTMQTFALFLALDVLGGKKSCAAVGVYLLMGAVGLPVFSGGQGGSGILLGATGGYLLGMLPAALSFALLEKRCKRDLSRVLSMVLALVVCYSFGTLWYALLYAGESGLWAVAMYCVAPFVIPDLLKLALALSVGKRLRKILSL